MKINDRFRQIETKIEKAAALIKTARRDLSANQAVDLTALELRIRELHAAVHTARQGEEAGVNHRIVDLQRDLQALGEELTAWYEVNQREHDQAQRRTAVKAYGKIADEG
jgi:hypothetical protein